ncbi:MAG: glycosyltransferase family 4 protein [Cyanobacteriota bacterium]
MTTHRFYPDIGGIESVSDLLAHYFVTAGHTVKLVTMSAGNTLVDQQSFPFSILRKPSALKLMSCYQWADVIFQNNLETRQLWPILFVKKPLVIGLHTWIRRVDGRRGVSERLKLAALHLADRVIACSESVGRDSIPTAIVVGNPYRSSLFRLVSDVQRRKSIVFLGRLVSDKGIDLLLKAFAELYPSEWRLSVIGSGPELEPLKLLADELQISRAVNFLGPLQGAELVDELNQHEIMVVPSRWQEPFGSVVLEGLAGGCVVLASDGGGLPDAVGRAGLLFQRGDYRDLKAKLSQLLESSKLRHELRSRAASHLAFFHESIVCRRYLDILLSVQRMAQ